MKAKEMLTEFYDVNNDNFGKAEMDDTRRPRLTMSHLQKLRKARDAERYDRIQHQSFLPDMYGASAEPSQGL